MFPDRPEDEGVRELWRLIVHACRADAGDPIQAWQEHIAGLRRRGAQLEAHNVTRLHYRAPGTDLRVGLPDGARWLSGGGTSRGVPVVVNIPTEEVFTAPHRTEVEGTVRSTLPLSHAGVLIENIVLRFEGGRIVDAGADTGEDVLLGAIDTDERARYLGEIALVPVDSPLASLNTVFYNTLYDENASCHLAIGSGYPESIPGGAALSEDELLARGINQSALHLDFMIGSNELDIDGETQSGDTIPVFRRGRWALP
jgi:aminopeptidase